MGRVGYKGSDINWDTIPVSSPATVLIHCGKVNKVKVKVKVKIVNYILCLVICHVAKYTMCRICIIFMTVYFFLKRRYFKGETL